MAETTTTPILEARNVRQVFRVGRTFFRPGRDLTAVDDVSFRVGRAEAVGLVGESGCGKSTLALACLGLVRPTSGEILLNGVGAGETPQRQVARIVQPIFQDPYSSLNPRKTVGQIVSLPLRVHGGMDPVALERQTLAMLDRVGLAGRHLNLFPNQLSGGQRQRVAIARALIASPQLVVCDEPTSALDVSVQAQILNLLQELQRELQIAYLFISHNLAVVQHLTSRVAVMYLGRIVEEADTGTLFGAPKHPYTRALLDSVLTPERGRGVPDPLPGSALPDPMRRPPGCAFHPRCPEAMPVCRTSRPPIAVAGGSRVECHLYDGSKPDEWRPSSPVPRRTLMPEASLG